MVGLDRLFCLCFPEFNFLNNWERKTSEVREKLSLETKTGLERANVEIRLFGKLCGISFFLKSKNLGSQLN